MSEIIITSLPVICADVFDTGDILPGGEALNLASTAARFENVTVKLMGAVSDDRTGCEIMKYLSSTKINTDHVHIIKNRITANNKIYHTPEGDRYHKDDSWTNGVLDEFVPDENDIDAIMSADIVFINYWAKNTRHIADLHRAGKFKLAVDFDVIRDFDMIADVVPETDFFFISGNEALLPYFKELSEKYDAIFNITLAEKGSVTYKNGTEYRVSAVPVEKVVDTTGCGDSYHAGFLCSYAKYGDIEAAMKCGSEAASKIIGHMGGCL